MKYSKEFYLLLARLNPAIYDAIYPHGPVQLAQQFVTREAFLPNFQTQGSVFGTDLSGELRLPAKLTWGMNTLIQKLQIIIVQGKLAGKENNRALSSYVSELADEYCGTKVKKPVFPPRPHWFDNKITIEEKVSAATLMSQAALVVKGTELETLLQQGSEKILDDAFAYFGNVRNIEAEAVDHQ